MMASPCWLRGQFCQGVRGRNGCEGMWMRCLKWFARTLPDTWGVIFTIFAGGSLVACPLLQDYLLRTIVKIVVLHVFPQPWGPPIVIYKFLKPLFSIIIISGSHALPTPLPNITPVGVWTCNVRTCMHKGIHYIYIYAILLRKTSTQGYAGSMLAMIDIGI